MTKPVLITGNNTPLRFLTCGGNSSGKSTLIGRLLYDTNLISKAQLAALADEPLKDKIRADELNFAQAVGTLDVQHELNSSIDVAYRTFSTSNRKFFVVDALGDEQDAINIGGGASHSELAVILVDASEGLLVQTRRLANIASLLGIRNVVLAINKMDLVEYSQEVFETICKDFSDFAAHLKFKHLVPIPLSARKGDNVVMKSGAMPWYDGPTLLEHFETVDGETNLVSAPFRMPVHSVNRPNSDVHAYSGTVLSGKIAQGETAAIARSGQASRVKSLCDSSGEVKEARAGQFVTIALDDEIEVTKGDVLVDPKARPEYSDQFAAHLLWVSDEELLPHRQYQIKIGAQTVPAHVSQLKHRVDVGSLEHLAARTLQRGEVGYCNFSTAEPIAFDAYSENRDMGGFSVIDGVTKITVGVGIIEFGLRRATNVHWQALDVNAEARAELKHQKPCILWFTGLSGSGKSTIANLVERRLFAQGRHTYILDGDNVRHGLSQDLGFTDADRVENIRRVAEAANLFVDAGLIVLASFISPFRSERQLARDLAKEGAFVEIFVDTPIDVCITRDPKGLYKRAQAGEIKNFTGIDSPYEPPENPELVLKTEGVSPEDVAERVAKYLSEKGLVP